MAKKFKILTAFVLAFCSLAAGAVLATACGNDGGGTDGKDNEITDETQTAKTKEEWQEQWASYTYSDYDALTYADWNSKTIVYQFSSVYSDSFTLTDLSAGESEELDTDNLDTDKYMAVTEGFGEDAVTTYHLKDYTVSELGIFMGPGDQRGQVLINLYDDYTVLILQASLFETDEGWYDEENYIWAVSYGIWDVKADMGGSVSLKLYYLTQDAAADTTTEVNDGLAAADGRYAVEIHDVGDNTGDYIFEPNDFRPLVLFQKSGDTHNSEVYMYSKSDSDIVYGEIEDFCQIIIDGSPYATV